MEVDKAKPVTTPGSADSVKEIEGDDVLLETLFGGICAYRRFWPGPGSKAFAVVINRCMSPYVNDIAFRGHCARVRCCEFNSGFKNHSSMHEIYIPDTTVAAGRTDESACDVPLFFVHASHNDLRSPRPSGPYVPGSTS